MRTERRENGELDGPINEVEPGPDPGPELTPGNYDQWAQDFVAWLRKRLLDSAFLHISDWMGEYLSRPDVKKALEGIAREGGDVNVICEQIGCCAHCPNPLRLVAEQEKKIRKQYRSAYRKLRSALRRCVDALQTARSLDITWPTNVLVKNENDDIVSSPGPLIDYDRDIPRFREVIERIKAAERTQMRLEPKKEGGRYRAVSGACQHMLQEALHKQVGRYMDKEVAMLLAPAFDWNIAPDTRTFAKRRERTRKKAIKDRSS
jgi:hypothetical protein